MAAALPATAQMHSAIPSDSCGLTVHAAGTSPLFRHNTMNNLPLRALLFLVWLVACMPALAQTTVTLQQGLNSYTGTTDTWLWSGGPDINHGGEDEWQMRFNTTTATLLRF